METIEKKIVSVATSEDLNMIKGLVVGLEFHDNYYGKFAKYQLLLEYKEYETLKDDLVSFYDSTVIFKFKFFVSDIQSFIKSFQLLRSRYIANVSIPNEMFKSFLESSIQELIKLKESILEPITTT